MLNQIGKAFYEMPCGFCDRVSVLSQRSNLFGFILFDWMTADLMLTENLKISLVFKF
jgi:hypothetical protein